MIQTNQANLEKINQIAQERTRRKKINHILLGENGSYIPYPIEAMDEEVKKELIRRFENPTYFLYVLLKNPFSDNELKKLLGEDRFKEYFMFITDWDETNVDPKTRRIYEELNNKYKFGKIDKETVLQIVRDEVRNGNYIYPPSSLNLRKDEWDEFLLENYSDKYRADFFQIEFEENPLFNTKIENILNYLSPSFDSDDIVQIKGDLITESQSKRLIAQKNLLLEVIEQLHDTGMLEDLFGRTYNKVKNINELLSDQNKIQVLKMNGDEVDFEESYNLFRTRIESLDVEKQEDRIELIMLSRHMLNKYAKDIEKYETNIMNMYINKEFLEERAAQIELMKLEIHSKALEAREQFLKEIEETLFNPDFINDDEFLKAEGLTGLKKEIKAECRKKKRWVAPQNPNIHEHRKNNILKIIKGYEISVENYGATFKLKKDSQFDKELVKIKDEDNLPEVLHQKILGLGSYFVCDDATVERVVQSLNNINNELYYVRTAYEALPQGKDNDNSYKNFAAFVDEYLKYFKYNPNLSVEEFLKNELGSTNEYVDDLYKKILEDLHKKLKKVNAIPFEVDSEVAIKTMCKFLERKQKIYNLKSLNTVQLLKCRDDVEYSLNDEEGKSAINIGIDGFVEFFGTHYEEYGPESRYVGQIQSGTEELNEVYLSKIGNVYIPLPRVTPAQKEEFKKLLGYIKQFEASEIHDNGEFDRNQLTEVQNKLLDRYLDKQNALQLLRNTNLSKEHKDEAFEKINSYTALKVQIALGAGIECFRSEFMPESEVTIEESIQETSENVEENSPNIQNEELERLRREIEILKESNVAKDRTIEMQAQTIDKFKEKSSFMLEFIKTVKESRVGKIFFRNAIKRLPEGNSNDVEESRNDR